MDFTDQLKVAKPTAKANTLKTYNTILKTMYKKVFGNTEAPDIDNFKNVAKIMDHVKNDPLQTRKTKLSAIVALVKVPEYTEEIFKSAQAYKKQTDKSEMTEKLEEAEITKEEMTAVQARVKNIADSLNKKTELTMRDIQEIQNYIIVSLYTQIPPRRAIDFTEMVLKPTDKETQNYIDLKKSKFVFNNYKTATHTGTQEIAIPASLKKILTKWIKIIPDEVETLLFNSRREPLINVTLNQRLNEIFGPRKAVNSLRHYFLSQKYGDTIRGEDALKADMVAMGSNIIQARNYIKVNPKPE